jgi:predicted MPP superfamily phosphohydrolase
MGRAGLLLFFALIFIFLDVYSYFGIYSIMGQGKVSKLFKYIYFGVSAFSYFSVFQLLFYYLNGQIQQRSEFFNFMGGFVFTVFVTKLLFSVIMLLQDSGRVIIGSLRYAGHIILGSELSKASFLPERRQFITTLGTFIAGVPFFSLLYGITKGKYQYTVEKVVLTFKDLPQAFDGFRIVQISDIHSGSFDNAEKVKAGIHKINALKPDIVCFTGDLVNAEKEEIDPYIDIFSEISAKYGKFATLGNHDYYGSYDKSSPAAEQLYYKDFFGKFKIMGFDLLNNENRKIALDNDSIHIVGVENWGAGRWFPKKGDLDRAVFDIDNDQFKILMSHDPTHWDEKVLSHHSHIHLTLSGHTHGFQFGFQMPGFKWSPAQYRYKKWLGLYQEGGKYLYVNRGFGFLGFPGRVGMWPEITLIELKSEKNTI